jgi:hypothetical protein
MALERLELGVAPLTGAFDAALAGGVFTLMGAVARFIGV